MAQVIRGVGRAGGGWTYGRGAGGVKGFRLDGIENVTANINEELQKMKLRSAAGLHTAAQYILTDADIGTPPLVPHDTGNLRSSRFAEPFDNPGGDPFVVFGYNANYAAAVHEMLFSVSGAPINWQRPGSGPKFFEASIKRNANKILIIVSKYAEIGL